MIFCSLVPSRLFSSMKGFFLPKQKKNRIAQRKQEGSGYAYDLGAFYILFILNCVTFKDYFDETCLSIFEHLFDILLFCAPTSCNGTHLWLSVWMLKD